MVTLDQLLERRKADEPVEVDRRRSNRGCDVTAADAIILDINNVMVDSYQSLKDNLEISYPGDIDINVFRESLRHIRTLYEILEQYDNAQTTPDAAAELSEVGKLDRAYDSLLGFLSRNGRKELRPKLDALAEIRRYTHKIKDLVESRVIQVNDPEYERIFNVVAAVARHHGYDDKNSSKYTDERIVAMAIYQMVKGQKNARIVSADTRIANMARVAFENYAASRPEAQGLFLEVYQSLQQPYKSKQQYRKAFSSNAA